LQSFPVSYTQTTDIEFNAKSSLIKIAFLDVGQGDTVVISCPETFEAIVVDCIDANAVLEYLEQEQISYLRGIVITHLHADHYSSVADLLANYQLVPGLQLSKTIVFFNEIFNQKNLQVLIQDEDQHSSAIITPGKVTPLQNLISWRDHNKSQYAYLHFQAGPSPFEEFLVGSIQVLHPCAADFRKLEAKGLNNTSIVLRVSGLRSSALLTGDLEPDGWQYLRANHSDLRSDILKFPHHGGAWRVPDTKSLLDAVQPSVVVISVGTKGENYKHPNKDVFDVLSSPSYAHIRVLCTQATNQCQSSVSDQKKSVLECLDKQASTRNYKRIGSRSGCPCAGTVIVELGDKAHVVQPTTRFHQDSIIRPHFQRHKCFLPSTSSSE
jgi:beta-lactamase superfamily II metal-dependent hydrolase